jgi:predicted DCC family thiol-disulfide oxidoreductase YuxK
VPATPNGRPIILFDGVCLLCSTFIHFVLDHDPEAAFDFAPLQGPTGKKLLKLHGLPLDVSTVVLIDECGHHVRSTAALRVLARCSAPYSYLAAFLWLPRPLRDLGYKMVAAVRYRLFGQDDGSTCRRMTKAIRTRFHE